jgi:transcriptional regulator with XRE-family HTH domain
MSNEYENVLKPRGITQTMIGERAGMTQGHVSKILNGESPDASFETIAKVALAMGLSLDRLVQGVELLRPDGLDRTAHETPLPSSELRRSSRP